MNTKVSDLCGGDKTVVDDIATSHIRMVISIARKFSKRNDELVSVGLEGLMEAINKYPEARSSHQSEDKGITAYIAGYVRYKILRFLSEDTIIRVPQESQHRLNVKPMLSVVGAGEASIEQKNVMAVNEILKIIAIEPMEKAVIQLRRKGYNDYEIAEKIGVSVSYIYSVRSKLEKKFEELWDAKT